MPLSSDRTTDGVLVRTLSRASEKKVPYVCDRCGAKGLTIFHNYRLSQKRLKRHGKTFCRRCSNRVSGLAKRGKPIKKSGPRPQHSGKNHHTWKGGRFVASDGYVQIYLGPKSYRKEHFIVMEKHLGRRLLSWEVVHHKDGDKENSDLGNLALLRNESEHRKAHNSLYELSCRLVKAGLIRYREKDNAYYSTDALQKLISEAAK
jgi:DNA-directed RNA polymerase subunit RPC12/RpoP